MDVTWSDCHESWNSTDCIIRRFCSHTEYCLHVWSVWHCMRIALSKEISNLCRKEHQKSPLVDPFWVSCRGFLGYSLLYSCQFLSFCHLLSCFCAGKSLKLALRSASLSASLPVWLLHMPLPVAIACYIYSGWYPADLCYSQWKFMSFVAYLLVLWKKVFIRLMPCWLMLQSMKIYELCSLSTCPVEESFHNWISFAQLVKQLMSMRIFLVPAFGSNTSST